MKHKIIHILFYLAEVFFTLLMHTIKLLDSKGKFLYIFSNSFNKVFDYYLPYNVIPKVPNIKSCIFTKNSFSDVAVLLQGPLEKQDNFTLNTVRLYKKIYPGIVIIISTWANQDKKNIIELEEEDCIIILNDNFIECGFGNLNYQIKTTMEGIKKAKSLNIKYVLKSRSDLRINKNFSIGYMKQLIEDFPVMSNNKMGLSGRIITLAGNMMMPLYFSDFMYFGYTDDLFNLFDIPMDTRNVSRSQLFYKKKYGVKFTADKFYIDLPAEVYLINSFISKYVDVTYTVKFYWDLIKKYFITLDFGDIGVVWPKYSTHNDDWLSEDMNKYHNSLQSFYQIYNDELVYDESFELIKNNIEINLLNE